MFANCYKGRRVFITGHTGFKGSWLAAWLSQMSATVCGFADCVPTSPSHFEAMHLEQHVQDMRGDIRDRDAVVRAMKEFRPDVVFHLAAQALVRKSYEDAPLTFEANMLGTLNMLEAVRQCPSVEAAVFITSDKCYRNDEWVWGYRETDHLGGDDPYSASKGCAEIIAHSYFKSFFKDGPACATVRAGNVIGGGDWAADRIVPDCARAWAAGQAVQIRSPWATPVRLSVAGRPSAGCAQGALRDPRRGLQLRPCRQRQQYRGGSGGGPGPALARLPQRDGQGRTGGHEGMHPAQALLRQGPGPSGLESHPDL